MIEVPETETDNLRRTWKAADQLARFGDPEAALAQLQYQRQRALALGAPWSQKLADAYEDVLRTARRQWFPDG